MSGNVIARRMAISALVVVVAATVGRLFGLGKEMLVAYFFGTRATLDAFLAALAVPTLLSCIVGAAMRHATIPVLSRALAEGGDERSGTLMGSLAVAIAVGVGALSFVLFIAARPIMTLVGYGFTAPEVALSARLLRILSPLLVLQALIILLTCGLQARQRFALAAAAPMIPTFAIVAALMFLPHERVVALAWGTMLGTVGCLFVLALPFLGAGGVGSWKIDWRDPLVRRTGGFVLPLLLGVGLSNADILIDRFMASFLAVGSISALSYAERIMAAPKAIFVVAISTVAFPFLSRQVAEGRTDEFVDSYGKSLRMAGFLLLPMTVGILVLADPLVRLLFQRGAFDVAAGTSTGSALQAYSPGLFFLAAYYVTLSACSALGKMWTVLWLGLLRFASNVVLNYVLMQFWGHTGIALATSASALLISVVGFAWLCGHVPAIRARTVIKPLACLLALAAVMGAGCWFLRETLQDAAWSDGLVLLVVAAAGIIFYAVVALLTRREEAHFVTALVRERLGRRRED